MAVKNMTLKSLPAEVRPRERLLAHGPEALADAELVALLLRTGTAGRSVLQMAGDLLERCGGVAGLLHSPPASLTKVKGLGPAKRAELAAVAELARRSVRQVMQQRPVFENPRAVADHLQMHLSGLDHECFGVLFLDAGHRLIAYENLFRGTLTKTSVYPREVVKRALALQAASVVLAHNHPSGTAEPSSADEALTHVLRQALALVDVRVLDHVVVARGSTVSMADRGLI
jgi:DNA repair protein RadC